MPSKSKAQQKIFGMAHAIQKGEMSAKDAGPAARRIAREAKPGDVKDFAKTKRKGLPAHVGEALQIVNRLLESDPGQRVHAEDYRGHYIEVFHTGPGTGEGGKSYVAYVDGRPYPGSELDSPVAVVAFAKNHLDDAMGTSFWSRSGGPDLPSSPYGRY